MGVCVQLRAGSPYFIKLHGSCRKRSSASAGIGGVGVVVDKTAVIQPVPKVDLCAVKVYLLGAVNEYFDTVQIKDMIVGLLPVEIEDIGKARTAAAFHT